MQRAGAVIFRPSHSNTTYRTKAAGNVNVENTLHYLVVCQESREEFDSKPHTLIRAEVRLQCFWKITKELQMILPLLGEVSGSTEMKTNNKTWQQQVACLQDQAYDNRAKNKHGVDGITPDCVQNTHK